jgi:hypothetical protein
MNDGTKPDGARAGRGARTGGARGGASVTAGATLGATETDGDGWAPPALGMKDDGTNVDGAAVVASAADGANDDGRNLVDTGAGATTGADAGTAAAAPIGVGAIAGANDDGAKVAAVVAAAAARSKNVESLESPNALANGSSVEPERPFVDSASEYSVCIEDDKDVSETGGAKVAVGWSGLTDADTATALVGGESDARGTNAVG